MRLSTVARREEIDVRRHEMGVDIKAVTLHRSRVAHDKEGWQAIRPWRLPAKEKTIFLKNLKELPAQNTRDLICPTLQKVRTCHPCPDLPYRQPDCCQG